MLASSRVFVDWPTSVSVVTISASFFASAAASRFPKSAAGGILLLFFLALCFLFVLSVTIFAAASNFASLFFPGDMTPEMIPFAMPDARCDIRRNAFEKSDCEGGATANNGSPLLFSARMAWRDMKNFFMMFVMRLPAVRR